MGDWEIDPTEMAWGHWAIQPRLYGQNGDLGKERGMTVERRVLMDLINYLTKTDKTGDPQLAGIRANMRAKLKDAEESANTYEGFDVKPMQPPLISVKDAEDLFTRAMNLNDQLLEALETLKIILLHRKGGEDAVPEV
jgi:hypothetical protein